MTPLAQGFGPLPPADLLIRAARVIDPASGLDATADVLLQAGRIAAISPGGRSPIPDGPFPTLNAEGLILAPGLIDPHVHLREPGHEHKETIETGSRAAVAGGFTAVCCMPNTSPALDTPELVRFILLRGREVARCRVFPVAAGTKGRKGEQPAEIRLCAQAGAVAFSDDGDAVPTAGMMLRVLQAVGATGRAFMQHCQDATLAGHTAAMHAGSVSTRLGLPGWPRVAEELTAERDIRLVASLGQHAPRYHVQHISSAGTIDLIRRARAAGLPVTGEASPHHLLLTHEACAGPLAGGHAYDTLAKVNPPLREDADRRALVQAVADGTVTVLATDHAPHAPEEKAVPFEDAAFGSIGLDTAIPAYAEALISSGAIDWPRLIALLTIEPARLCNLDALGLGTLTVGGPADLTLIDPDERWTVTPAELAGQSHNSVFLGRAMRGRAVGTIVAGRGVWSQPSLAPRASGVDTSAWRHAAAPADAQAAWAHA